MFAHFVFILHVSGLQLFFRCFSYECRRVVCVFTRVSTTIRTSCRRYKRLKACHYEGGVYTDAIVALHQESPKVIGDRAEVCPHRELSTRVEVHSLLFHVGREEGKLLLSPLRFPPRCESNQRSTTKINDSRSPSIVLTLFPSTRAVIALTSSDASSFLAVVKPGPSFTLS